VANTSIKKLSKTQTTMYQPSPAARLASPPRQAQEGPGGVHSPLETAFPYSTLYRACLPLEDPGETLLYKAQWDQYAILLKAGTVFNPRTQQYEKWGLPYGRVAHRVLTWLEQQIRRCQRQVEVEESLREYLGTRNFPENDAMLAQMKNQLMRLAASCLHVGYSMSEEKAVQMHYSLIREINFVSRQGRWDTSIVIAEGYFQSICP
jgi:hypothetical protein